MNELIELKEVSEKARKREWRVWELGVAIRACGGKEIPSCVWERNETGKSPLEQIRSLSLSKCTQLVSLPSDFIRSLTNIKVLDLSLNSIEAIDGDAFSLLSHTLESLHLFGNQISVVPSQICSLSHLQDLSLAGNKIEALPADIWKLSALTNLSVACNKLVDLPIALPQSLESLNLSSNHFTTVPNQISELQLLRKLDFSNNRDITELPSASWWSILTSLEFVSFSFTSITNASSLSALPSARHIDLRGCHSLDSAPILFSLQMSLASLSKDIHSPPGLASTSILRQGGKFAIVGGGCFSNDCSSIQRSSPPSIPLFNLSESTWENLPLTGKSPLPQIPASSTPCFDTESGCWICFGGLLESGPTDSTIRLLLYESAEIEALTTAGESRPCARWGHISCLTPDGQTMVIHGGKDSTGKVLDDAWILNFRTLSWEQIVQQPSAIALAGHCSIVIGHELLVFGGEKSNGEYSNEIVSLDLQNWTWKTPGPCFGSPPSPRSCMSAALDETSKVIYIIGGTNGKNPALCDAYALDLRSHTWYSLGLSLTTLSEVPTSIWRHSSISAFNKLYFFGGMITSTLNSQPHSSNMLLVCQPLTTLGPRVDL